MKAVLRQVRISPKKANLVAELVRRKKVTDAIDTLRFTPKKAARIIRKIIESAAANAETNFKQNKDLLYIKEIIVTEGPTYKRSLPISKGRVHPILKRTSHITVKVEAVETIKEVKKKAPVKKEANKVEEPKKEEPKKETSKSDK